MEMVELETAVDHILQACEDTHEHPFFFLVGAGISHPPVPLASEIVEHCKATAARYKRTKDPSGNSPIDIYSHWFQQAYPQPIHRQRYLRQLIEGKPISDANLRLAHLLLEKRITNLVVTPNFDTFLSQALVLFGEQAIVCDHPNTVDRIDSEQRDLQIVHVHGTYWFYDCCNLRGEIETRSQPSGHTTLTMASLLDRLLSRRSPVVIGYGGWEGDVIMTALKRRLQTPLAYNLYWFCYRRSEVDSLPTWLKETHQPVYLVVPPQRAVRGRSVGELSEGEAGVKRRVRRLSPPEAKGFVEKGSEQQTLSAQVVLEKLIQSFDLKAPQLTRDPLGFLSQSLRRSLIHENMEKGEEDIYYIRSVISRLERAEQKEKTTIERVESLLERIRDAMRRSQYGDAIRLVVEVDKDDVNATQLRELMDTMWSVASNVKDDSAEELSACDQIISIGERLLAQESEESTLCERLAWALVNKGIALGELDRREEAIGVFDEGVRRFGEATAPGVREQVARALVNKGITLGELDRHEEEIAVYDEVLRRFGEATAPGVRERVAGALVNKGVTLGQLDRHEEEIAVYDEVLQRFGEATAPGVREQVARALVNKGVTLGQLDRHEEAIGLFDEVVRRFGEATEPGVRKQVAWALIDKGIVLYKLNRHEEAIGVFDEVVRRFGEATEPGLREQVARALVNKGITLGELDRHEEAIGVFDEVVRRFGEATEPGLREQWAGALVNKGVALGQLKRHEEAMAAYDEVVRRFGEATEPDLRERVARAMINKGVELGQLKRHEEAMAAYDEVVRRFGEATEPDLRERVARALVDKGLALGQLKRHEEAMAAYDEVVRRFGEATEPGLREQVGRARANKQSASLKHEDTA